MITACKSYKTQRNAERHIAEAREFLAKFAPNNTHTLQFETVQLAADMRWVCVAVCHGGDDIQLGLGLIHAGFNTYLTNDVELRRELAQLAENAAQ